MYIYIYYMHRIYLSSIDIVILHTKIFTYTDTYTYIHKDMFLPDWGIYAGPD